VVDRPVVRGSDRIVTRSTDAPNHRNSRIIIPALTKVQGVCFKRHDTQYSPLRLTLGTTAGKRAFNTLEFCSIRQITAQFEAEGTTARVRPLGKKAVDNDRRNK